MTGGNTYSSVTRTDTNNQPPVTNDQSAASAMILAEGTPLSKWLVDPGDAFGGDR